MKRSAYLILMLLSLTVGSALSQDQDWHTYAQDWLNGGTYYTWPYSGTPGYSDLTSSYTYPFYRPQGNLSPWYPFYMDYLATPVFTSTGASQQDIEAQHAEFESPYLPYFGTRFLSSGERYQIVPLEPTMGQPFTPYQYGLVYGYPATQPWPVNRINWSQTVNFARTQSSFRVLRGNQWTTP